MKTIILSRTDSIGDVLLTLPVCVWLKSQLKDVKLIYLGKAYTKEIVHCFEPIDQFVDWNTIQNMPSSQRINYFSSLNADAIVHIFPNKEIASLAQKARIPIRIGTSHRFFHLLTCSHRINFSRKNSDLHEAQLNFYLMKPFGLKSIPTFESCSDSINYFKQKQHAVLPVEYERILINNPKTVILHPKSQGSALEWPVESYIELSNYLVDLGYAVFFTGTEPEGKMFSPYIPNHPYIVDTTGKLTLAQLITLIARVKNLIACSTGPLHIAGLSGIRTIGLFVAKRPIHPGRWKPLGKNVVCLVNDSNCLLCQNKKQCSCMNAITIDQVLREIQ